MLGSVKLRAQQGQLVDVVIDTFKNLVAVASAYIEKGFIVQSWVWDGEIRTVEELEAMSKHPVFQDRPVCEAPIYSGNYYEQPSYCDNDVPCSEHPGWYQLKPGGHSE